jgi:hypothetical protein
MTLECCNFKRQGPYTRPPEEKEYLIIEEDIYTFSLMSTIQAELLSLAHKQHRQGLLETRL